MDFTNVKIKYLSFGSPLMDIIGDVNDEFLTKYNITLNTAILKPLKEINWFSEFLTNFKVTNVMGGCQFNAMRVFNWMYNNNNGGCKNEVAFLGSVGDDEYQSNVIQSLLMSEDIVPLFERIDNFNTGVCLVICNKRDRAHITDLGASEKISKEYIDRMWNKFKDVKLIYTELFIIKSQKEFVYKLAKFGSRDETIYGFNLPSAYILHLFQNDIEKIIEYADVIFANKEEAKEFYILYHESKNLNYKINEITPENLAKFISRLPKININKKRVAIVTDGPEPAYCSEYDHKTKKENFVASHVKFVSQEKIVDTNGAGDSFAGGFLSQYMANKPLSKCMSAGHWAASIIIQKRGCQIDPTIIYNDKDD